jgi:hypothetical protein
VPLEEVMQLVERVEIVERLVAALRGAPLIVAFGVDRDEQGRRSRGHRS